MYSDIQIATLQRSGIVTLNRPERRNALDNTMIRELTEGITALTRQEEIRTIIITGAGESFCSGMDIGYIRDSASKAHEENVEDAKLLLKLLNTIQYAKKQTIAMVNGPALGGGCGISAACDFIFAAEGKAKFGAPEVRLGFVPAVILNFLIRRMGEGKAREFVLQGGIVDWSEAKEWGLATDTLPFEQLQAKTLEFCGLLASSTSPSSVALTKELFMRLDEMTLREGMDFATNLNAMVRKTDDFRKGMESFLKKEKAQW